LPGTDYTNAPNTFDAIRNNLYPVFLDQPEAGDRINTYQIME